MKCALIKIITVITLLLLFACTTFSITDYPELVDVVFKNVNLIPMTHEGVLKNQSVYVSNGIIKQIGDFEKLSFPEDAAIINAEGKYLIPGFNDMHIHTHNEAYLPLYLANGVTSVRQMWGEPIHLEWKKLIQEGDLLGPRIYSCGPLTDGEGAFWEGSYILTDPAKVEAYVIQMKEAGYDYIKVYDLLSKDVFFKIIEVARQHDIPVVGHVPQSVDINDAISSGMTSIEHFVGYDYLYSSVDDMADTIKLTGQSDIWNCPTLTVLKSYTDLQMKNFAPEKYSIESNPLLQYVHPLDLESWDYYWGWDLKFPEAKLLVESLHKNGAKIVSGTDLGNPYLVPGFSLIDELELLNEAGLSPYDVLRTTTINSAQMLGIEDHAGTIEVGKNADFVLLEENPIIDIKNTRTIAGVMIQGRWLDSWYIENMLKDVAYRFSQIKIVQDNEEEDEASEKDRVYTKKETTEVLNGDFSNGDIEWIMDDAAGGVAEFAVIDEVMEVDILKIGFKSWSVGIYSEDIPFETDKNIRVSFDVKADDDIVISSTVGMQKYPYTFYGESGDIKLTGGEEWKSISYDFLISDRVPRGQLAFALGQSSVTKVYIDNVILEVID